MVFSLFLKEASTNLFIMESNMVFSLFLKVASTYLFIMESNMVFSLFLKKLQLTCLSWSQTWCFLYF